MGPELLLPWLPPAAAEAALGAGPLLLRLAKLPAKLPAKGGACAPRTPLPHLGQIQACCTPSGPFHVSQSSMRTIAGRTQSEHSGHTGGVPGVPGGLAFEGKGEPLAFGPPAVAPPVAVCAAGRGRPPKEAEHRAQLRILCLDELLEV